MKNADRFRAKNKSKQIIVLFSAKKINLLRLVSAATTLVANTLNLQHLVLFRILNLFCEVSIVRIVNTHCLFRKFAVVSCAGPETVAIILKIIVTIEQFCASSIDYRYSRRGYCLEIMCYLNCVIPLLSSL